MSDTHIIEVKELEDSVGDLFIEIPPVLLNKLGWEEGDDVKFTTTPAGSILIRKVKMGVVELNFDDDELFKYMQLAHKKGISFNQLCNEALGDHLEADLDLDFANNSFEPIKHEQTK